ncbi:MAG: AMP-binding protein [Planctomycetota bacterium]
MTETPRSIAEVFDATVERSGDAPALGLLDGGELAWMTWAELGAMVHPVTTPLKPGDYLPHSPRTGLTWVLEELVAQTRGAITGPSTSGVACANFLPGSAFAPEVAAIVPTSGTGGEPRCVALSQENLVSNTIAVAETIAASVADLEVGDVGDGRDEDRSEVRLSFLPFSHLYARVCDLYCWVYRGSRMVLAESRETIFRDCKIARPTTLNGVPYFFQKAIDLAERDGVSLRELLGGRIRRCYSGGAALSEAVQQRFAGEGIPLMSGYGLSEASPVVTVSTVKANKPGTVGKPLPGVEVRIAADGEVLVRGPNVMLGYLGADGAIDQPATAEVLRDGWLHTGDRGELDADGFLRIIGRKKELIVLATGKNVSPSGVEARLAASPWIEQVAVVGEGCNGLSALIVPNPDRVRAEVRRRRLWVWSKRRALAHPAIRQVFANEIQTQLAGRPPEEQVRGFQLLGRAFSAELGEITAKLSLRRPVIEKNFAREIEAMNRHATRQSTIATTAR